jgi:K+-transporting ATPase A subunit
MALDYVVGGILAVLAVTKPLGTYMYRVFEGDEQPLPRVVGPLERVLLRLCGADPRREQTWSEHTLALLAFSVLGVLVTYAIQRLHPDWSELEVKLEWARVHYGEELASRVRAYLAARGRI